MKMRKKTKEQLAVDFSELTKGEISQWIHQFKYISKDYIDINADVEVIDMLNI